MWKNEKLFLGKISALHQIFDFEFFDFEKTFVKTHALHTQLENILLKTFPEPVDPLNPQISKSRVERVHGLRENFINSPLIKKCQKTVNFNLGLNIYAI